ncbi:alpha/beta fold hydrolase [Acidimangrovimonas sediminis]|uniref:alpha/beta fold hydrolase n=1 Tax=Acidimangrovimonas sediminis TaxID=2056283 RepID=UPI001E5A04B6|nr:alpha/beta hydrolase [Acidimangrovimonas sediminis]
MTVAGGRPPATDQIADAQPADVAPADPVWVRRLGRPAGQDARAALMVHCSLAHSGEWRGVAERLGDRLAITAFDLPGHGRAPDHDPARDIGDEAVAMGLPLLEAAEGQVDLIGHSFGGTIALRLAIEAPGKVRSLTLIEPTLFAAARAAGLVDDPSHEDEMRPLEALIAAGDAEGAARRFTGQWGTGPDWSAQPEAQRAYITERVGLIVQSEPVLWHDSGRILPRIGAVTCPVLLMQGADSPPIIGAILTALERLVPDTRRVSVPGARHMLPVTHPAEVSAALAGFLGL